MFAARSVSRSLLNNSSSSSSSSSSSVVRSLPLALAPLALALAPLSRAHLARRTLRTLSDLENLSERPAPVSSPIPSTSPPSSRPSIKSKSSLPPSSILTLSCPDRPGIVSSVTTFLAQRGMNIMDSAQFGDPTTGRFFMRVHFSASEASGASTSSSASDTAKEAAKGQATRKQLMTRLENEFEASLAREREMRFEIHPEEAKPRTLIMVSKIGHCLNDLLFRLSSKSLPIEVPLIVSNHADYAPLAAAHGIPFYHLPIDVANGKTKEWQEEQLIGLCEQYDVELVVLARYMQILSPKLCSLMSGRIINIHHSFLPSFKGAKPYHQAFERGVKLIGATAHFVTSDLDEGPIIEQAVERVNHNMTPAELVRAGADVEARVLARAVRWTAERRVLANGGKTVVFN